SGAATSMTSAGVGTKAGSVGAAESWSQVVRGHSAVGAKPAYVIVLVYGVQFCKSIRTTDVVVCTTTNRPSFDGRIRRNPLTTDVPRPGSSSSHENQSALFLFFLSPRTSIR